MTHVQHSQMGYAEHFRHMIEKINKLPREERSAMGNMERLREPTNANQRPNEPQSPTR